MRTRGRTRWQAWNHNRSEVLRIAQYPNPVLNEMWFLTVDTFIRISVFIAKAFRATTMLACFRGLSKEYIQFFDIRCYLFMRLHFTIGCYDYRRTTRLVNLSISASLKSLLLIMCIDAPESTTNSRSSGLRFDPGRHLFSEGGKNVALFSPLILCYFWPPSTLLRGHLALATLSPLETDPQILEHWRYADEVHSPGQINPSEGFWSRILVWRAIAFVSFTRWIGLCMSKLFRRIDFGGVMSWNTQPNCRVFDDRRPVDPRSNSWSRFLPDRPDLSWPLTSLIKGSRTLSCQSTSFSIATALLSSFFWDLLLGCSSPWRCA